MLLDLDNVSSVLGAKLPGQNGVGGAAIDQFVVSATGIPANEVRFQNIGTTGFAELTLLQIQDGVDSELSFTFETEGDYDHEDLRQALFFTDQSDNVPTDWVLDSGVDGHFTNDADETISPDEINVQVGCIISAGLSVALIKDITGSVITVDSALATGTLDFIRATEFSDLGGGDEGVRMPGGGAVVPASVKLLIQSGGDADNSQVFTDSSATGHTVNVVGTVRHETDNPKFGTSAIFFPTGGTRYLSVPDSAEFTFTGDITIEFWIKNNGSGNTAKVFGSDGANTFTIFESSGSLVFNNFPSQSNTCATPTGVFDGDYHHIAFVRNGTQLRGYRDGIGGTAVTQTNIINFAGIRIGMSNTAALPFNGNLEEIRLSDNAVYTANFTPPTAPFNTGTSAPLDRSYFIIPNKDASMASTANLSLINDFSTLKPDGLTESAQTNGENIFIVIPDKLRQNFKIPQLGDSLLIQSISESNGSQSFADGSTPSKVVTANGNVQHSTALSKFDTSSILLDGTGDFLSLIDSPLFTVSGGWTFECFVRVATGTGGILTILGHGSDSPLAQNLHTIRIDTSLDHVQWFIADSVIRVSITSTNFNITRDVFHHLRFVKNGDNFQIYVDGISEASVTTSFTPINHTGDFKIGRRSSVTTSQDFEGNLEEIRITPRAVNTGNFTPPASAFTPLINGSRIIVSDRDSVTSNGDGTWSYASNDVLAPGQAFTAADVNSANRALSQANDAGVFNQMTHTEFSALTNSQLLTGAGGDGILVDFGTAGDFTGAAVGFKSTFGAQPEVGNIFLGYNWGENEVPVSAGSVQRATGQVEARIQHPTQLNGTIILQAVK